MPLRRGGAVQRKGEAEPVPRTGVTPVARSGHFVPLASEGFARNPPGPAEQTALARALPENSGELPRPGQGLAMRQKALAILGSEEGRVRAAAVFDQGVRATGTVKARECKLTTLSMFAEALGCTLFPLETETLGTILGAMKESGYRSAHTYLHAAKTKLVELRHPVDQSLALWIKGGERSMLRDRGPTKRAATINPEELQAAGAHKLWHTQYSIESGQRDAWASLLVSIWWMLREAETLSLKVKSVLEPHEGVAELRLGATKTDLEGTGKRRCFECTCSKGDLARSLCPSCTLLT